ncbi:putative phosphatidylinositol-3,4, 5-trisphosphate 3-phosphatase [Triangularia setosa]|uniref:phosphatidylinositol-3,4,5-trisphosphate 3-phosphatase n=1 Tax=Triangularia setosa TaxID=2587417 RepID=A0AAN7A6J0_9PEZI|nr:putative phosphatidylinositol-3,4, 5-trisphosphate 3-phosphatase [Podospora setosa]
MASLLRQLVAGPRAKHQETGLDLCYVTKNIIATSGPSQTYPQLAYRNPLDRLVSFLDSRHGKEWMIWEFRAEGTGYPDEAVYGRVRHYPWPDHHPPPFCVVPVVVGGMRQWLNPAASSVEAAEGTAEQQVDKVKEKRVVVVHCKAGKGRSGTMACSYLIAEEGWNLEDALKRFTERRMRVGFGEGVSIPSQLRWVGYVDRWANKGGKVYRDQPVEILEVHVWGLRNGVKVEVEGYVEEGKKIRVFHTFTKEERVVVQGDAPGGGGIKDFMWDMYGGVKQEEEEVRDRREEPGVRTGVVEDDGSGEGKLSRNSSKKLKDGLKKKLSVRRKKDASAASSTTSLDKLATGAAAKQKSKTIAMPEGAASEAEGNKGSLPSKTELRSQSTTSLQNAGTFSFADPSEPGGQAVIFKPTKPVWIPNSDVNISVERRNKAPGNIGLTMVTAVAHVWFNTFFEGNGPEQGGKPDDSGVFTIDWDKMDGIKGSSQRGTRACDRISVVWRTAPVSDIEYGGGAPGVVIHEPGEDSPVPEMKPADWKGDGTENPTAQKRLGLRVEDPESASVSKASSVKSQEYAMGSGGLGKDGHEETKVEEEDEEDEDLKGVKVSGPAGEEVLDEVVTGDVEPAKGEKADETAKGEKADETAKKGFIME